MGLYSKFRNGEEYIPVQTKYDSNIDNKKNSLTIAEYKRNLPSLNIESKQALKKPVSSYVPIAEKTKLRQEAEKQATNDFIAKNGQVPKGVFNKDVKAYSDKIWDEDAKTNVNKSSMSEGAKKLYKNIDYIADAPYRIPFVKNILNGISEGVAPGQDNRINSRDINSTRNSKSKIVNGVGDFIGGTLGMGMNPGGAMLPGKNLLNIADDIALQGSMKIAPKLGTGTMGKLGTAFTRGAIDGGVGGGIETARQGQGLKELPSNITTGALGGGVLFGAGKGLGLAKEGINNKVGKMFDDLGNPINTIETPQLTSNPFKTPGTDGLSIPKKPISEPKIETPIEIPPVNQTPKMNIVNPKGMNFYQTMPPKLETTIHQQPKVTIRKEKVNVDGGIGSIKIEDRNTPIQKINDKGEIEYKDPLSSRKTKALQYYFPELHPIMKEQARLTLGELENGQKGETIHTYNYENGDYYKDIRTKDMSVSVNEIQAEVPDASYLDIKKGLNDLILDKGRENNANAKKIERVLDKHLTEGYEYGYGNEIIDMPPNKDYIETKNMLMEMDKGTKVNVNNTVFKGNIETPITKTIPGERVPVKQPLNIEPLPPVKTPRSVAAFKDSPTASKLDISEKELQDIIGQGVSGKEAIVEPPIDVNFDVNAKPYNKIVDTKKEKTTFKEKMKNAYSRIVDDKTHIKDASEKAYMLATNTKSVGGTVDHISTKDLVDMKGNKIGEGFKNIIDDIPKDKEEVWKEMLYQKHNIPRATEGKPIFYKDEKNPFTSKESEMRYKLLAEQNPELVQVADRFTKFIDTFMNEWGVKSGLTKEEVYKELRDIYPDYVPTQREFSQLEKGMPSNSAKGLLNVNNPVREAKGSSRDVLNPIENVLNLINRTVRSARYNEVGQALIKEIEGNPTKMQQFAEIIPPKDGMFANTDNVLSVLVEGKQKFIRVNDIGLLKSLQNVNTTQANAVADGINKYVSTPFKKVVTQYHPLFALTNIARDLPTAYIYGSEANPFKFAKNLGGAAKDILTKSENYNKYKAIGGGGGNFFKGNDIAKTVKDLQGKNSIPKKFINVIETFNNFTETVPRLAEFNKIYKESGDIQKALYSANDVTTNFSRGGDITKTVDKVTPYLNAGVQGLDKLARKLNPKNPKQALETLVKGGVAITTPSIFFHYINADNEDYKALDNRTKDNNYCVPIGDGKFFKIPKSRELGVLFGSFFERLGRAASGEEDSFKDFGTTLGTNISVANPISEGIFRPLLDLRANKDFADRPIVNQSMMNLSPENQYDNRTTELSKFIGDKFKISPKQMDFLIKSYTGVIGTFAMPLMTKGTYQQGVGKTLASPITNKFIADPVYSNQATNDFYSNMDKISKKAADRNFNDKIPSKTITDEEKMKSSFTKSSKIITDINKEIRNTTDEAKISRLRKLAQEEMKRTNELFNKSKYK